MKDLVVKLTLSGKDFENGLKNAKGSMKKFNLDLSSVVKSFAKFTGGIGAAVSVSAVFVKNIKQIETVSDGVDRSMKMLDESVKSLFTSIGTNSFKGFIDGLKEVVKNAKDAYNALDNLGTYLNFSSVEAAKNQASQSEARYMIAAIKKGDIEGDINFWENELRRLQSEAEKIISKEIKHYENAVAASDKLLFSKFKGNEAALQQLREKYTGSADKNELAQQTFPRLRQEELTIRRQFGRNSASYRQWSAEHADELAFLEIVVKREKDLSEINKLLIAQENKKAQLYGEKRTNLKYLAGGGTSGGGTSGASPTGPTMTEEQIAEYMRKAFQNEILAADREKDSVVVTVEIEDEEIVEAETEAICEAVARARAEMAMLVENTQMAISAAQQLGNAFISMGKIADGTMGDVFNMLGSVIGQIASTVSAMMTLAGAETVEGVADLFANTEGGIFTKLAVAAAGLAGILGIIATAKSSFAGSFAEGGVVGGTSYTGDRLWARVNSGEMIIPYNDWHNANTGGGQVRFVIEGSQLKGVLDNYETIQNL